MKKIILVATSLFVVCLADINNTVEKVTENVLIDGNFKELNKNSEKISKLLIEINKNGKKNTLYRLVNIEEDFIIPTTKDGFSNFKELKQFINANTDKDIYITAETKFSKKVKDVLIRTQLQRNNDLKNFKMRVVGKNKLSNLIKQFEENSGFTLLDNDNALDENSKVELLGKNAHDFISNLSEQFDLYFSTNYKNKEVTLFKYSSKNFLIKTAHKEFDNGAGLSDIEKSKNSFVYNTLKKEVTNIQKQVSKDPTSKISFLDNKIYANVTRKTLLNVEDAISRYNNTLIEKISLVQKAKVKSIESFKDSLSRDEIDYSMNFKDTLLAFVYANDRKLDKKEDLLKEILLDFDVKKLAKWFDYRHFKKQFTKDSIRTAKAVLKIKGI